MIKISVIIPAYNAEKYIRECLDSVINQTYQNLEIICIDDGSQDRTGEIIDEYAKADPRFVVIHRQNEGLVSARKAGVKIASGSYVCYVDADDWIDSEMYMTMYKEGIKLGVDVVSVGICREFGDDITFLEPNLIPPGLYKGEEIKNKVLTKVINTDSFFYWGLSLTLWHYTFKRELLLDNQLAVDNRIQMGEDAACCLFCLYQCETMVLIDQCLYHYRQSDSTMKRTSKKNAFEHCQVLYHSLHNRAALFEERERLLKKIEFITFFNLLLSAYTTLLEGKDFLFPFSKVKQGENIIIYGAGIFGEEIYETVKKNKFCNIAGWVDTNYRAYQKKMKPVSDPKDLIHMEFDHIVIAITNPEYRKNVIQKLQEFKMAREKIADIDITVLVHEMLPKEFF